MVLPAPMGREKGGELAVLVLSSRRFSAITGYALVAPITQRGRKWPFEIPIDPGSRVSGVVLPEQARSVDFAARHARFLGKAPIRLTEVVAERITTILET